MPFLDERGRLFGRINLIDAAVALVVIGLIPLSVGAFLVFRPPLPAITAVTPASLPVNQRATLRIVGTDLRPFLTAKIGPGEFGFLVLKPTEGEVTISGLPAGTYDVALFDRGQELTRKPAAVTVTAPAAAVADVRVQFVATREAMAQLSAGDADVLTVSPAGIPPPPGAAVLTSIGDDTRAVETSVEYWMYAKNGNGGFDRSLHVPERLVAFTGTLTVPVTASPTGWMYKDMPVKAGARFTFESRTGMVVGSILSVDPPAPPQPVP